MQAWKQVDAVHAAALESGSVRIGTAASFAVLESGRTDAADRAVADAIDHKFAEMPEQREALARRGMWATGAGSAAA